MNIKEPPAGSAHYREGWSNGYEQAQLDRDRGLVDWPARFRAAADVARLERFPGTARHLESLGGQFESLAIGFPNEFEAIGRALNGEDPS